MDYTPKGTVVKTEFLGKDETGYYQIKKIELGLIKDLNLKRETLNRTRKIYENFHLRMRKICVCPREVEKNDHHRKTLLDLIKGSGKKTRRKLLSVHQQLKIIKWQVINWKSYT